MQNLDSFRSSMGSSFRLSSVYAMSPPKILLVCPFAAIGLATKWFVWLTLWYSTGGRYWLYLFRNTIRRDAR